MAFLQKFDIKYQAFCTTLYNCANKQWNSERAPFATSWILDGPSRNLTWLEVWENHHISSTDGRDTSYLGSETKINSTCSCPPWGPVSIAGRNLKPDQTWSLNKQNRSVYDNTKSNKTVTLSFLCIFILFSFHIFGNSFHSWLLRIGLIKDF